MLLRIQQSQTPNYRSATPPSNYNAATNWSLIHTIAINVARVCGYDSLTKAERFLAHDIDKLFSLLE